ncbi:hypothetical protein [Acinetobacter johnsonii]|uniref:hypothetical protein n=1 Tax=Acinetobacter johnsonii TaxID=40214 RepID=UPI003AF68E4E
MMNALKTLSSIFEHRIIRIPDYQRGYAWQEHQLNDGEFKHEVRQFQKPYDNQQAEQTSLMV